MAVAYPESLVPEAAFFDTLPLQKIPVLTFNTHFILLS